MLMIFGLQIMKIKEVPQDRGIIDGDIHEVCYAVEDDGSYTMAQSAGWDPKNVANEQAWGIIEENTNQVILNIKSGKLSPLAFHMASNQMNIGLLADYAGFSRLRVWWHLKPAGYRRLKPETRGRYARIFGIHADDLNAVPEHYKKP